MIDDNSRRPNHECCERGECNAAAAFVVTGRVPTAIELSAYVGLVAVGLLSANLALGLLMAGGYNPARHWPYRHIKLFRLHNWTGYLALVTCLLHPLALLFASPRFRVVDIAVPLWSPVQPVSNVLGAMALYLVLVIVVTSYFRRALGRR